MGSAFTLVATLALYALGTLAVLVALVHRSERLQRIAFLVMVGGLVAHTVYIGSICVRTGHPPLTNLSEMTTFMAWTILVVHIVLFLRFRIRAAGFFIYPLVLLLAVVSTVVHERFQPLDPSLRSNLFVAHLLLASVGVAALLVGLGFSMLYRVQERSLRRKERGPFYEWIPSLQVCDLVSYRALAVGFGIYTLGLLAGVLWSYRTASAFSTIRAKELGAYAAWIAAAILLQAYISGSHRTQRALIVSAALVVFIFVAMFGIRHA